MADSIEAFLCEKFEAHGFSKDGGQTRLRNMLKAKYGIDVTPAAVSLWAKGKRNPELPQLLAILDLCNVYGEERAQAINMSARRSPVDPEPAAPDAPEAA